GRRVIEQLATDTIPVSRADALKFCCNAIATPEAIVLHRGISASLRTTLTRRGYDVYELDLSEFLKAGGSAKCLVLRV
ncbi:MAG: hypothetical protein HYY15_00805, partial [Candidatus Omnitrophica bacterium]|nr:hypothetical protein [Candidatus Omnitrophota bacterium]